MILRPTAGSGIAYQSDTFPRLPPPKSNDNDDELPDFDELDDEESDDLSLVSLSEEACAFSSSNGSGGGGRGGRLTGLALGARFALALGLGAAPAKSNPSSLLSASKSIVGYKTNTFQKKQIRDLPTSPTKSNACISSVVVDPKK